MKKSKKDLPVNTPKKSASKAKNDLLKNTNQDLTNTQKESLLNNASSPGKTKVANKFSIKPYLKQHKWGIALYVILTLLQVATSIPFAILPAHMIVALTEANYAFALKIVIIEAVIYGVSTILTYQVPNLLAILTTNITMAMSLDIAEQAFKISSNAYENHQTANFLQRIRTDPDKIFNGIISIMDNAGYLFYSLAITVYLLTVNAWTSLILILYFITTIITTCFRKKAMITNQKKVVRSNEKVTSLLNEVVRSERDIKSLNLETKLKDITKSSFDNYKSTCIESKKDYAKYDTLDKLLLRIFIIVITVVGIVLMDKGFLVLTTFLILYNNKPNIRTLSNTISIIINKYAEIKVAYERINELYADDDYELEKFGTVHRKNLGNDIEFKNVNFSYTEYKNYTLAEIEEKRRYNKKHKIKGKIPKREEIGKKQVFEDLSFKIEPNTTVAFVGKSGCGKSTILNLISKIYTTDSGKVLIGGVDINKLDKSTLRSSVALVNQFPYIFDMTIKENLLLAKPDATEEEIDQVVKDAALDEFIAGLTKGLDTKVGESGMKLSGGQKQRLAIARALLKKSNVIILDESTSSLDNLSQNIIKESIDRIKGKSTIIIVAHRLSTIKNVDKIFFMDEGKIVDTGSFEELNKRNKQFKIMYNAESIED